MNIIFLDVDGVLNSINSLITAYKKDKRPHSGFDYPFDDNALKNLKKLVNKTNAYLVITSTWRKFLEGKKILLNELKKYGLDTRVIGYTDVLNKERGEEVKDYLAKMNGFVNFIILDDDDDFCGLEEYLIKTNYQSGLTKMDVDNGIKKLLKK